MSRALHMSLGQQQASFSIAHLSNHIPVKIVFQPGTNSALNDVSMQWAASSDLQRAARAAAGMLGHPQPNKPLSGLQRLLLGAAQAALAVNPTAAAGIAASISRAEAACAGLIIIFPFYFFFVLFV